MKKLDREMIQGLAKRSDTQVMWITFGFALGGALLDIGADMLSAILGYGGGISMLWGIWIPLCFLTIPPIHYLSRLVQELQKQIDSLEARSGDRGAT
jgi:hypothetical protein